MDVRILHDLRRMPEPAVRLRWERELLCVFACVVADTSWLPPRPLVVQRARHG
jgi:hypothetical protein